MQSPVSHLLRSNNPPSESDAEATQDMLLRLSKQSQDLIAQVTALNIRLLESQQAYAAHQAIFSPLRRVPAEVLMQIFLRCSSSLEDGHNYICQAPLNLSHVCGRWREVVHSMPEAWATLFVKVPIFPKPKLFEMWLERSGSIPLSFSLKGRYAYQQLPPYIWGPLVSEMHRWRHVDLLLNSQTRLLPEGGAPLLESVFINTYSGHSNWFSNLCSLSPRLRRVNISGCDVNLSWSQLTHLKMHQPINLARFHEIMSRSTSLVEVSLTLLFTASGQMNPSTVVVLPDLCKLDLTFNGVGEGLIRDVFRFLVLPSLQSLSITQQLHARSISSAWPPNVILSLLSRSSCILEDLTLHSAHLTESSLMEILQSPQLRSLSRLNLKATESQVKPFVCDLALQWLTIDEASSPREWLPNLTDLTLHGCIASTDGLLYDMVASRFLGRSKDAALPGLDLNDDIDSGDRTIRVSRIQRVDVLWSSEMAHIWDMACLRDLRQGGLVFEVDVLSQS